jgi:hypothetical protein
MNRQKLTEEDLDELTHALHAAIDRSMMAVGKWPHDKVKKLDASIQPEDTFWEESGFKWKDLRRKIVGMLREMKERRNK